MEWISVKDRMPEPNQNVLCWNGDKVCFARYEVANDLEGGSGFMVVPEYTYRVPVMSYSNVSYWMPLPERPIDVSLD